MNEEAGFLDSIFNIFGHFAHHAPESGKEQPSCKAFDSVFSSSFLFELSDKCTCVFEMWYEVEEIFLDHGVRRPR